MKVFVAGADGYLGWPLALHLTQRGHEVFGADCYLRREIVAEVGSQSATPILTMNDRLLAFRENLGTNLQFRQGDMQDYDFVRDCLRTFQPDAIVHLGEIPSAPYSMVDVQHCVFTHTNNLVGTLNLLHAIRDECPQAHLVKLGTMGEYGTPNVDIPEGFFEIEYRGRKAKLPFPKQAGSWYHQTKVHDTNNVMMACRLWGLKSTDLMQGVVFGTRIEAMGDDDRLLTRFDFDGCFGTAINRFCAQAAIGRPLTPYGSGEQKRGFIPLRDSMQCLTLAIELPPQAGEYRVCNQFENVYDINGLAQTVKTVGDELGLDVQIRHTENPRIETERHYYNPDRQALIDMGYVPSNDLKGEVHATLKDLTRFRDRIEARSEVLLPSIRWSGGREQVGFL